VLELLTGAGLAASAGLNAYIPLLALGLLSRYTSLVDLPADWHWLSNGWVMIILGLLLAVELVADKIPAVDHVNDILQTLIRPTAGGLVFAAGSTAETAGVRDPGDFFASHQWIPLVTGLLMALVVHGAKAAARPVINTMTVGVGAPVVSTVEDGASVGLSFAAILLPVLVAVLLIALVLAMVLLWRWRQQRRLTRTTSAAG